MRYMGSKARIAKHILPIILKDRKTEQWYIEPFVGGFNMIDKVDGLRWGNDNNYYLTSLFKRLRDGWVPPLDVDREYYYDVKNHKDRYLPELVGYVGFCCSYSGKFFGGYAGLTKTKIGFRDYIKEARNNILNQSEKIKGITITNGDYANLNLPARSLIYCDIPYKDTTNYDKIFDYERFYHWCFRMKNKGHIVFISEYNMPCSFKCIWQMDFNSSLSANGKIGGNKVSTEKLFTL